MLNEGFTGGVHCDAAILRALTGTGAAGGVRRRNEIARTKRCHPMIAVNTIETAPLLRFRGVLHRLEHLQPTMRYSRGPLVIFDSPALTLAANTSVCKPIHDVDSTTDVMVRCTVVSP